MQFELIVVGFGNVGRRFVKLVDELGPALVRDQDVRTRVIAIATGSHGHIHRAGGLDVVRLADDRERGLTIGPVGPTLPFLRRTLAAESASARDRRLVVVETTTLDVAKGQPAIAHVDTALRSGAHVITSNKGPAAFAYRSLERTARRMQRCFLFESAVMDGVPIFNLARTALPCAAVTGFRGVVNSTTQHMLTAMEEGESFDRALQAMQRAGIAEADPTLDIDGWDAAAKAAILANVLMGGRLTPRTVRREGLDASAGTRARAARAVGRRLKLVASGERTAKGVQAAVRLLEVPQADLLGTLEGQQNAVVLETDILGEIGIVQRGSGLTQTAYGLVADLVAIAREIRGSSMPRRGPRGPAGRSRARRGRPRS